MLRSVIMAGEPTLSSAPEHGVRFGPYLVARAVGSGGMGTVYEAVHEDLGKRVALKVLHPAAALDPLVRKRFVREGQAAARIRHPHIVDVTHVGLQDGVPWLVMEFLEGEDLAALLARDGSLAVERVADLLLPVISAVGAAHRAGVLHRDLKPANILLSQAPGGQAHPVVVDFGISRIDDVVATGITQGNAMLGTPSYMSPEQVKGLDDIDARTDQYALGVILYECATGRKPFKADTLIGLVQEVCNGTPRPPRELRPELPEAFEALVLRAMGRMPEERFPTVEDLGRALFPFAGRRARVVWSGEFGDRASIPGSSPAPPPALPPALPPPPRGTQAKFLKRAGVLAVLVAGAWTAGMVGRPTPPRRTERPPTSPGLTRVALAVASGNAPDAGAHERVTLEPLQVQVSSDAGRAPVQLEPDAEKAIGQPRRRHRRYHDATAEPAPNATVTAQTPPVPEPPAVTRSPGGTLILP